MSEFDDELFDNPEERRAYEEFCAKQEAAEAFQLDRPALVCRWRMARRQVPLLNRHIRALSQRTVGGAALARNLLSWAKQHVEWSLAEGEYDDPNGVLMMVVDVNGNAAMTVGAYEPLEDTSSAALRARAELARAERGETGVAPEVLCATSGGALLVAADPDEQLCGSMTLVEQLATTRGYEVRRADAGDLDGAVLLVSDEHGVVLASDAAGTADDVALADFLVRGVAKLFA